MALPPLQQQSCVSHVATSAQPQDGGGAGDAEVGIDVGGFDTYMDAKWEAICTPLTSDTGDLGVTSPAKRRGSPKKKKKNGSGGTMLNGTLGATMSGTMSGMNTTVGEGEFGGTSTTLVDAMWTTALLHGDDFTPLSITTRGESSRKKARNDAPKPQKRRKRAKGDDDNES
eukprot:TRINITY_DN18026_c0_g1_i1.p1 TRINITY_DN18026_c0_g1~~TRINITY_DN18026_c0_g1_i1.p1  ORF type:complete len:171 (+),score=34.53 TRINITY_DN18026_c0_g1_i1:111-623(+)